MESIYCFSIRENAYLLKSVGISVFVSQEIEYLKENLNNILEKEPKIIIIDEEIKEELQDISDKYIDSLYPIFITLPFGGKLTGKSLNEMKNMIEKTIGISGF